MEIIAQPLPGVHLIQPNILGDTRGCFVKTFNATTWASVRLPSVKWAEEYWSMSKANVIRGMHFQAPPHDHEKLVMCVSGCVLDVLVDLRVNLPTYGNTWSTVLSSENARMLFIPRGIAHGFLSQTDATVCYKVTSEYMAPADTGVRWDTIAFDWPASTPIVSERDRQFQSIKDIQSPFASSRT
jgi:dTDP-4-dehydrorhamnose 3,5-epimerase